MFNTDEFVCRGTCAGGWPDSLIVGFVVSDLTMLVVYSVLVTLAFAVYLRNRHVKALGKVFLGLACVFFWCGLTHGVSVLMFWYPAYWFAMWVHAASAMVSVGACCLLYWMLPAILRMPRVGKEAELYEEVLLLRERVRLRQDAPCLLQSIIDDIRAKG